MNSTVGIPEAENSFKELKCWETPEIKELKVNNTLNGTAFYEDGDFNAEESF